jgi:hypothetical protein
MGILADATLHGRGPGLMVDCSPEKAGGGGSIPSLATMFSVVYTHPKRSFIPIHSKTFGPSRFAYVGPSRFAYVGMRPVWSRFSWGRIALSSCPLHFCRSVESP